MKKLVLDDLTVGQAVTILHGPRETVVMPPMMLGGENPPSIDTAIPGRVFIIESIDMNIGLIMLKALDGGGQTETKMQQAGPLMALFPEPSKPDTYMYRLDAIELAAVSPDWLNAYVRNFCAHKGGMGDSPRRARKQASTAADDKVASTEGRKGPRGPTT